MGYKYSIDERVDYYLRYVKGKTFTIKESELEKEDIFEPEFKEKEGYADWFNKTRWNIYGYFINRMIDVHKFDKKPRLIPFWKDFQTIFNKLKSKGYNLDKNIFLGVWGDSYKEKNEPLLVAGRTIAPKKEDFSVLLPLDFERMISYPFKELKNDISYESKSDIVNWRGFFTGYDHALRLLAVVTWANYNNESIDVYFSGNEPGARSEDHKKVICKTIEKTLYKNNVSKEFYSNFCIKESMSIKKMLKFKFLLSIEGNSIASDLKWKLASNSVVLSPPLVCESWFMEGKLEPWVHYVPVDRTFLDLEEKRQWCLKNTEKVKEIIKNANEFMDEFRDEEREMEIASKVLKGYTDLIKVEGVNNGKQKRRWRRNVTKG